MAIESEITKIDDPHAKGLIGLRLTGAGTAWIFRDGVAVKGEWRRAQAADRMAFVDAAGNPIPFAAGQVWYLAFAPKRGGALAFN